MNYKILPRRVSILVFSEGDDTNYTASCQLNINGNKGTIDSLVGSDFYKFIKEYGFKPFNDLGLLEVTACMTLAHKRLLTRYLKNTDMDIVEQAGVFVSKNNVELIWVLLTRRISE